MENKPIIGVIGTASSHDTSIVELAFEVGCEIARRGAVLLCGGLGGVMEAACRGAKEEGGITIGILPGSSVNEANPFVDYRIATGLGEARNLIIVLSSSALVACGGGAGTLSEIAFALKHGKPLAGLRTWQLRSGSGQEGFFPQFESAREAVAYLFKCLEV
ncbi:TIGR00725 family protein [Atrimonas thermophila]|jgi:hypothetical protein|uniref:TIGR00725 family protein n=1 Tax=Atrimonas thermophila TaxID=3064161 RepID=UPI00399CDE51